MKVARIAHEIEQELVVKIFVIPEKQQDVDLRKSVTDFFTNFLRKILFFKDSHFFLIRYRRT